MKIGVGAIFRDEFEYVIEWIAWHILAGFDRFIIADNGSVDGTRELLEALELCGIVDLIYQPVISKNVQDIAYERIYEKCINDLDAILYIDADEFIIHNSLVNGAEKREIEKIFENTEVGMLGINWRCFGSSGLREKGVGLVIERFFLCANDVRIVAYSKYPQNHLNNHIKHVVRTGSANKISGHFSILSDNYKSVSPNGDPLPFVYPIDGLYRPVDRHGMVAVVDQSSLRINHYVIKSRHEFFEKKVKRGDVVNGMSHDRNEEFFKAHDVRDNEFHISESKLVDVRKKISEISSSLDESIYSKDLRGCIDIINCYQVAGWLSDADGRSSGLCVITFVNGHYQGKVFCRGYRGDVLASGLSVDGFCGFRFTHAMPLVRGDIVEVFVYANSFKFSNYRNVI